MQGDVPRLRAFAEYAEVFDSPSLLQIADLEVDQFLATKAMMIEKHRNNGTIAHGFEAVAFGRGIDIMY